MGKNTIFMQDCHGREDRWMQDKEEVEEVEEAEQAEQAEEA